MTTLTQRRITKRQAWKQQTKQQLEKFEKNASKVICVDATHRANQYAFSLVTNLIIDIHPVGLLISNREDEITSKPFLEEIKRWCQSDIEINVTMTDDDNSSWNTLRKMFSAKRHFLCKWHMGSSI